MGVNDFFTASSWHTSSLGRRHLVSGCLLPIRSGHVWNQGLVQQCDLHRKGSWFQEKDVDLSLREPVMLVNILTSVAGCSSRVVQALHGITSVCTFSYWFLRFSESAWLVLFKYNKLNIWGYMHFLVSHISSLICKSGG